MAFPSSPAHNQTAQVAGITYIYNSTTNAWRRVGTANIAALNTLGNFYAGGTIVGNSTLTTAGNITTANVIATGYYWANGNPFLGTVYGNTDVATYLPVNPTITGIQSNVGGFYNYANVTYNTIANAGVLQNQITGSNAAIITANTALKGYVDNKIALLANAPAILNTLGQIAANLQADENSIGTILGGITAANTNISTNATNLAALQANVGSYYVYSNVTYSTISNAGSLQNQITGANVNISALQSSAYANANVASYLPVYSGNISANNVGITGNIFANVPSSSAATWITANAIGYAITQGINAGLGSIGIGWGTMSSPGTFMNMSASGGKNFIGTANRDFYINDVGGNQWFYLTQANGNITLNSTTTSISSTTGALTVKGGAGIGGNLYVGANAVIASTTFYGIGAWATSGGTVTDATMVMPFGPWSIYSNVSSGGLTYARSILSKDSGNNIVIGSTQGTGMFANTNIYTGGTASINLMGWGTIPLLTTNVTSNTVVIANTQSTTSLTSGALQVAGGVAIGNGLYVAGIASFTGGAKVATITSANPSVNLYADGTQTSVTLGSAGTTTTLPGNLTVGNLTVTGNVTTVNYETVLYTETANVLTANSLTLTTALPLTSGGTGANTVTQAQTNLQVDPAGTAIAMAIALG